MGAESVAQARDRGRPGKKKKKIQCEKWWQKKDKSRSLGLGQFCCTVRSVADRKGLGARQ